MSTPLINTVPTTEFTPAPGNDGALQYGVKWGLGYGQGVVLTYSFPDDRRLVRPMATRSSNSWYGFELVREKAAVKSALAEWTSVANLTFIEVERRQEPRRANCASR